MLFILFLLISLQIN